MRCPACGAESPSGARFCEQCGAAMEVRCPQCGTLARPGAKFCVACGQSLEAPAPASSEAPPKPASSSTVPAEQVAAAAQAFKPPSHLAEKIRTEHSAMEGERRQVTVLFGILPGLRP